jgi:hypothetical protein
MLMSGFGTVGGYGTIAILNPLLLLTFYHEGIDHYPAACCNSFNLTRRMN